MGGRAEAEKAGVGVYWSAGVTSSWIRSLAAKGDTQGFSLSP